MDIVFIAPPSNTKELPPTYKQIIKECKKFHHTIFTDYLTDSEKNIQNRHKMVLSQIKQCDGVIVEGTVITVELSRFITMALQYHIPTLLLYQKNNPDAFVFESSRLLSLKKYDKKNISKLLETFFKQVNKKRLLYRFNLMLSKEMDSFIMDVSKSSDISKADYIRSLILYDMNKKK